MNLQTLQQTNDQTPSRLSERNPKRKINESTPESTKERIRRKIRPDVVAGSGPSLKGQVVPKHRGHGPHKHNDPRHGCGAEIRKRLLKKKYHARHGMSESYIIEREYEEMIKGDEFYDMIGSILNER